MSKKSKILVGLVTVAVVLFAVIQFWIIPANQEKKAAYAKSQADALTHDISTISEYQSAYVGDNSNTRALFDALPLNSISKKFAIDSEACTLTVNYLDSVQDIGEEKVQRDLIYNTVAAMAAIDNLAGITYDFSDKSYAFTRTQIEAIFGAPPSDLLEQEKWKEAVQDKLSSKEFCQQFYK